jgi:hypothetical protein
VPCDSWYWESGCLPLDQLEMEASVQLTEGELSMAIFQHSCCGLAEVEPECKPGFMRTLSSWHCEDQIHTVTIEAPEDCEFECGNTAGVENYLDVWLCEFTEEAPTWTGFYRDGTPVGGTLESACQGGSVPCSLWYYLSDACEPEPIVHAEITANASIMQAWLQAECCDREKCTPEGIFRAQIYECGTRETTTLDLAPCPQMECPTIENAVNVEQCEEWSQPPTGFAWTRGGVQVPLTFYEDLWNPGFWVYEEWECQPANGAFTSVTVFAPPGGTIGSVAIFVNCCEEPET